MNTTQNKTKIFTSDSFCLSAFLIAEGCELTGVKPSELNLNKFIFCFSNSKKLQQLKNEFFNLRALVKPQDFANAQKTLRSIIYSKKAEGR